MRYIKLFEDFGENTYKEDGFEVFTNITDGGRFWGSIGAGVLPFCKETKRFLLPFRSLEVNEPNTWGVWGGKLDDMETNNPMKGAKKEFMEETRFNGNIKLIPSYIFEAKDNNGNVTFRYHNFIGILDKEFNPVLNWETEKYKWVTLEEMLKIEPKHFGLSSLLENDMDKIIKL